ncbi:hypothetical protein HMPREF2626_02565 [Aerococcus sp. HMSC062A02]|nr:hypothetical protein HMPREF2626_02565 [Aerococcus sp. HMSC062A02]OHO45685.1 hypothetical protein HMPREF2705_04235 [Aerococcus sp. HMSC035B07]
MFYLSENNDQSFGWGHFILGILFIILALFAFRDPLASLMTLAFVFAIGILFRGIYQLMVRHRLKESFGIKPTHLLIFGIINILLGLYLVFKPGLSASILPFIFAFWIFISAIFGFMSLSAIKQVSRPLFWLTLILNIIALIVAVFLIFNPLSALVSLTFLVAFYFLLSGIQHIIYAF